MVEVITGVERRRRWRVEDKLRIVAEAEAPGSNCTFVARRHDLSRGLLWTWRRQVRRGILRAPDGGAFLPVRVVAELPYLATGADMAPTDGAEHEAAATSAALAESVLDRIESVLPDGICVRVRGDVGEAALRRVLTVLRS